MIDNLPRELQFEILSQVVPTDRFTINSGLANVAAVSKKWQELACQAKRDWVDKHFISLATYHWITPQELSRYVKKSANFEGCDWITDDFLELFLKLRPKITSLYLYSHNIKKFPNLKLTYLTHLVLSSHELEEKPLLKALPSFTSLQHAKIHCNNIDLSKIISALSNLPNFTSLYENSSADVNSVSSLLKLKKIKFLRLGPVPEKKFTKTFTQLKELTALSLSCLFFSGNLFLKGLAKKTQLNELDLCAINGLSSEELSKSLSQLTLLEHLKLATGSGDWDCKSLAQGIQKLVNLKSLCLFKVQIPQKELAKALTALDLTFLDFHDQECGYELLEAIGKQSSLETLILQCSVGSGLESICNPFSNLKNLTTLSFKIKGMSCLNNFDNIPKLETLILDENKEINYQNLLILILKNIKLSLLSICDCKNIYEDEVEKLRELFPSIEIVTTGSNKVSQIINFYGFFTSGYRNF